MSGEPQGTVLWNAPIHPSDVQEPIQPWDAVLAFFNDLANNLDDLDDIGVQQILCHDLDELSRSLEEEGVRDVVEVVDNLSSQLRLAQQRVGLPLFPQQSVGFGRK